MINTYPLAIKHFNEKYSRYHCRWCLQFKCTFTGNSPLPCLITRGCLKYFANHKPVWGSSLVPWISEIPGARCDFDTWWTWIVRAPTEGPNFDPHLKSNIEPEIYSCGGRNLVHVIFVGMCDSSVPNQIFFALSPCSSCLHTSWLYRNPIP